MKRNLNNKSKLLDAIEYIEASKKTIAPVLKGGKLIGTVSDGDIRRGILNGKNINSSIKDVMNSRPVTVLEGETYAKIKHIIKSNKIEAIPLVDRSNRFIRVIHKSELFPITETESTFFSNNELSVLVLAGGKGERLLPITMKIPKPMITVGKMPIIERQILNLSKIGVKEISISINHLSDVIEDYFNDGSNWNIHINYLKERTFLGTAGPISLMDDFNNLLVVNGDVLSDVNYISMFKYHQEKNASLTIGAVNHHIDIPYGVLEMDGESIINIKEKPSQYFLCNAGIYMVSSSVKNLIPKDQFFEMTDLIDLMILKKQQVEVFPIHEKWIDIGNKNQLHEARKAVRGV